MPFSEFKKAVRDVDELGGKIAACVPQDEKDARTKADLLQLVAVLESSYKDIRQQVFFIYFSYVHQT